MHVAVTGGAGFIGANLVRTLLGAGHQVTVLDDLSTGSTMNLEGLDARLTVGTVLDTNLLDNAFRAADAVVHLAARPSVPRSIEDPVASHHANATGTLLVLEAARRAGDLHTIVASSSSVYGANPTLPKCEDLRPEPVSPYAVSKLATESYALSHQQVFNLPTLAFRFFNVFGPLQSAGHAYAAVIPAFLDAALAGRPLPLNGDGLQSRDFTYVGSVARVICEAVERQVTSSEPVNLAFGSRHTLRDVIGEIESQLGEELAIEQHPPRRGDVRHSQADHTRLQKLFPAVEPVAFTEGLRRTIDWLRTGQSD